MTEDEKESSIKDLKNALNNLECNIFLKNLVLYMRRMSMEWSEFIKFTENILYLYISWLSGILLGYLIRKKEEGES